MSEHEAVEILLVEDDPADVELALHTLRRQGLANVVKVVGDGAAALEYLHGAGDPAAAARPRVMLLDLDLPKVDGLEVLRAVKDDHRTCALPVVVLTSSAEERDIVDSYSLGVHSYINKPVDFEQFAEAMRAVGMYWLMLARLPGG